MDAKNKALKRHKYVWLQRSGDHHMTPIAPKREYVHAAADLKILPTFAKQFKCCLFISGRKNETTFEKNSVTSLSPPR